MSGRRGSQFRFTLGVAGFVTVSLLLNLVAGLPVWLAVVLPALVLGGLSGIAQRTRPISDR
jgi:hypothetical protein